MQYDKTSPLTCCLNTSPALSAPPRARTLPSPAQARHQSAAVRSLQNSPSLLPKTAGSKPCECGSEGNSAHRALRNARSTRTLHPVLPALPGAVQITVLSAIRFFFLITPNYVPKMSLNFLFHNKAGTCLCSQNIAGGRKQNLTTFALYPQTCLKL